MRIILTHEQADFDALASLLAAHLLDETSLPVLPARLNRNLRAFLTLYGAELPFMEARDIHLEPGGRLEHVTLVDTQSLVTLKGMGKKTSVAVIDHHEIRSDLPAEWTFQGDRVGACTTLLVELLRDVGGNGHLSAIHATLLLLGIYEDTGSLTYASTTARDVHAAAYLLERGANLKVAAQFLNPPLSDGQRQACDRLLAAAEHHEINGQNVVIACAELEEMNEEISAVAHKIRDLLDPHALFLLVSTSEGVRLVARSTSDQVNVARVAARFGGGGHERAAAALVRREEGLALPQARARLLEVLPQVVQPSLTVGKLMSHHPRLLEPGTPAEEAARLMRRYGYEGFPVVREGRLIGLLTRRAVDRALAHKLNLPASSLMEAGEVYVHPEDAVEQLQKVMTHSGWGQVPVVERETGRILGIVTRTDLLRSLASRGLAAPAMPEAINLAAKLEAALPPEWLALLRLVAAEARAQRSGAYIVGGFVRDLILERPSLDFDIVLEGNAIDLARSLAQKYGGRLVCHARFGTAKWRLSEQEDGRQGMDPRLAQALGTEQGLPVYLDLISARTEFYEYPSALPTVERSSIKLDLHRRDFTINTLALRLDGRHYGGLYDFYGGLADLRNGLVRVLHSLSFVDDPTRMARAVRFEQRFGFKIEERTGQLIGEARDLLRQLSGDRLRHEFDLILAEQRAPAMLARLDELGVLGALHPDFSWKAELADPLEQALRGELDAAWQLPLKWHHLELRRVLAYCVWFSALNAETAGQMTQRLRLAQPLAQSVDWTCKLSRLGLGVVGEKPSRACAILDEVPLPALYALRLLGLPPRARAILQQYITTWRHVQVHTNGHDLLARGLAPGPRISRILDALRAAWLDGEINSAAQEAALLETLLANR